MRDHKSTVSFIVQDGSCFHMNGKRKNCTEHLVITVVLPTCFIFILKGKFLKSQLQ